ncbi:MAG: DUF2892 domain-containing protein [Betaproteobacteria bacterium]|jgi:hypothetical protein|nr:DUF2892 domain-containing protein [Betaproteobacteria bacterium]MDH5285662.1 DUF2892 domain-containing protein [Betaproteobacteria bacterium]
MQVNVGGIDRAVRIVAGLALILFALFSGSAYAAWGWIGVVPLATGLIGWCPLYLPFGIRTCRTR